ncbi:MAG TPA: ATP-binding protein, partial [Gemmatimonadaceae bacterium]
HGTQCRRSDGVLVDVSLSTTAMRNALGEPASIVGIYADVTARVQLEAEFRQAQKMEAVGRLAGGVAHDFNNLLTVITSFSSMILADADADAPWRDDVREIKLAADRAARLTRQLLAFSRRQVLRPQVVDLNATIEDLEKMLRRLIGEDVALETRLAPDLWPVRVDPGQIEQVVMNLVVNARDAMTDGGSLRITTSNEAVPPSLANAHGGCAGAGEYVCLVVTDTGAGMSPEVRSHIFEPFFTTKGPGKGTGLGLSTIYGIVQQSDGFIQVESAPGIGSTFRIFLPRSRGDVADTPAPAAQAAGPENARTVLLVEDDAPVRAAIRAMLQRGGYEVIEAAGGEEALRVLERDDASVHVVLTDIVMPRVGGRELGRHVLAHWPALPVIYMTGYAADTAQGHWALERDAVVLDKPFTAEPLMAALKVALGRPAAALGRPAA